MKSVLPKVLSAEAIPDPKTRAVAVRSAIERLLKLKGHRIRHDNIDGVYMPIDVQQEHSKQRFFWDPNKQPARRLRVHVGPYRHLKQFVERKDGFDLEAIVQHIHERVEQGKLLAARDKELEKIKDANERLAKRLAKQVPDAILDGTSQGVKIEMTVPADRAERVVAAVREALAGQG